MPVCQKRTFRFLHFLAFNQKKPRQHEAFFWFLVDGLVEHLSEFIFVVRAERIQLGHENSY